MQREEPGAIVKIPEALEVLGMEMPRLDTGRLTEAEGEEALAAWKDEVRAVAKKLRVKWHPDRVPPGAPPERRREAERKSRQIGEASAVLLGVHLARRAHDEPPISTERSSGLTEDQEKRVEAVVDTVVEGGARVVVWGCQGCAVLVFLAIAIPSLWCVGAFFEHPPPVLDDQTPIPVDERP